MKTKKIFEIEIERNNVTPAQFLAYLRQMQKRHPEMANDFDLRMFATDEGYDSSYTDGTPDTKPCEAETCKGRAYDKQTYIRNFDGSCYNEIIEFQFWDDKTGYGYYYTVQKDVDPEDQDANTAEVLEGIAQRAERTAERATKKAAQIREYLTREGQWLTECYVRTQTWEAGRLDREAAEAMQKATECRQRAALLGM